MCVEDMVTWVEIAHHPAEENTHPQQEKDKTEERDHTGKDLEKEVRAKEIISGDRQTSVVEKGEREFRHSTNGLDKIIIISRRGKHSINGRHQAIQTQDHGHNHCNKTRKDHLHGLGSKGIRNPWGCIVLRTGMASNGEVNRIGRYKIKEVQLGR